MRERILTKQQEERRTELSSLLNRAHDEERLHIDNPLRRGGIAAARIRLDAVKRWEKELRDLL